MTDGNGAGPGRPADDRQPPWSKEAEFCVLGAMLIDAVAVEQAVELVDDAAFYREANRRIFRAMARTHGRGDVVDVVTLADDLTSAGELESAGGMPYLARLVEAVPTAANVEHHCRILRDKAALRGLIETATAIVRDAYEASAGEADEVLERAEARILEVADRSDPGGYETTRELLERLSERIEEARRNPGGIPGLETGFPSLDRMTGGLKPGEVWGIGGRTSSGKTAFGLGVARHVSAEGVPVGIFSLEMPGTDLMARVLSAESGVPFWRIRDGDLSETDDRLLAEGSSRIRQSAPLAIVDTPSLNPLELRSRARRMVRREGAGLIVVDYLQRMSPARTAGTREQEVSEASRAVKVLAMELDVPVLLLSQLSRALETRPGHRPVLSDLRESGAIEQDADVVAFLHRPELFETPGTEDARKLRGKASLILAKQRNGETGDVPLRFEGATMSFESEMQP